MPLLANREAGLLIYKAVILYSNDIGIFILYGIGLESLFNCRAYFKFQTVCSDLPRGVG